MQDSYYIRSPGLESPFGMIGDIPGGYPLYSGNPLQSDIPENLTDSAEWQFSAPALDMNAVLLAISFAVWRARACCRGYRVGRGLFRYRRAATGL